VSHSQQTEARVAIVGWFPGPEGSAGAQYVVGLAKAMRLAGATVTLVSAVEPTPGAGSLPCRFEGFDYLLAPPRPARRGISALLARYAGWEEPSLVWLRAQPPGAFTHVLAYSGYSASLLRLQRLCRQRGIAFANIVVEWYDPCQFDFSNPITASVAMLDSEVHRALVNRRIGHLICISRYLEKRYQAMGCHTVRVPPLVDLAESKWPQPTISRSPTDPIRLICAGNLRGKESFIETCRGLAQAPDAIRRRFQIQLPGPNIEEVKSHFGADTALLPALNGLLELPGRLHHRAAIKAVASADYSVILRPMQRFSRAGFPTKFVESLACGTPVIANLTSDLGDHLRESENGLIATSNTASAFRDQLLKIIELGPSQYCAMRTAAKAESFRSFSHETKADVLGGFLREMRQPLTCHD